MATEWPSFDLSFPNQQQSMAKKFVKEGQGAYKEMDATKAIISILMLQFERNFLTF